eukprot:TRINITY_DN10728_c0_g1_i1.p1 TRINITY_DN10728_c0_g1~~TRINITY_DN10728_c0_g1_i1.p1  ORF type:complete len:1174 (+),score=321.18 TRINITY_DN10728_c0_g1_i1:125-3523(+)
MEARPKGVLQRLRENFPSPKLWRAKLARFQVIGLMFLSIGLACLGRVAINAMSCCVQGVMILSLMAALYLFSTFYIFVAGDVPVLLFEVVCGFTSAAVMVHDIITGGELDIWWLLLLVIDGMYLVRVHRAFKFTMTFICFCYITLVVVAKSIGWDFYITWDPEEVFINSPNRARGWSWGLSTGFVRLTVFVMNVVLVHGVAAAQLRMLRLVHAVGSDLAVFDLDAAEVKLLQHEGPLSDLKSLSLLCSNLRRYKPYLPPEVLVYDPDQGSVLVTQTLAVAKMRFPANRPDIKERILQTTFKHVNRRGGWVHSVDSSSALLVFGVERKARNYFEGIWGAGGLYIEVRRDEKLSYTPQDSPGRGQQDEPQPQRNQYTVRVLGARRSLEESAPLVEVRGQEPMSRRMCGTTLVAPDGLRTARYYADLGGTIIWFGEAGAAAALAAEDGDDESDFPRQETDRGCASGLALDSLEVDPCEPLLLVDDAGNTRSAAQSNNVSFAKRRQASAPATTPPASPGGGPYPGKTLLVYLQESEEPGSTTTDQRSARGMHTSCGMAAESGVRILSKLYGVTNLACEAALAIHESVEREVGIRVEHALALDECELGVFGNAERRTLTIQGSGVDRCVEIFEQLEEVPGVPPNSRGVAGAFLSRLANSHDQGAALSTPVVAAPTSPKWSVAQPEVDRPSLVCNHRAAGFLERTHGVVEIHAGAPDDGPLFAFGDRDRRGKLERQEMTLQSHLPEERVIALSDISPRETWVKVGEGKTGVVYAARSIRLSRDIAVKELHHNATQLERVMFLNELLALNAVRWDSICNFLGYAKGPLGTVYIVMEMCSLGPLSLVIYKPSLSDDERASLCQEVGIAISSALAYIHSKKMVHMDVAGRNILVTADGQYRLGDLGFLTRAGERSKVICYPWASPEAVQAFPHVEASYAYDVWSFGMLQFEILAGQPPFGARPKLQSIKDALLAGKLPNPPPCVQRNVACEKLWREFVLPCLSYEPLARPGMAQLASLFDNTFGRSPLAGGSGSFLGQRPTSFMERSNRSPVDAKVFGRSPIDAKGLDPEHNPYASNDIYGTTTQLYGTSPASPAEFLAPAQPESPEVLVTVSSAHDTARSSRSHELTNSNEFDSGVYPGP